MNEKSPTAALGRPLLRSDADRLRLQRMFAVYHRIVWRILRRRGLPPDAAADVTQQAFSIAAERLTEIERESEREFLVATALRAAWGFRRRAKHLELDGDLDRVASGLPDERVEVQLCDLALARVSPELAEVFLLYEIEGLSSTEISMLLEIPISSVSSRLRRGREQFHVAVTQLEYGVLRRDRSQ